MRQSIIDDMAAAFGIHCGEEEPVEGGWLNKKWRVTSDRGELLVKRYSNRRFSVRGLEHIDRAMLMQQTLCERGVKCPKVFAADGHVLRTLSDGSVYMVMEFCSGVTGDYRKLTLSELESLGDACGVMKREMAKLPTQGVKAYFTGGGALLSDLHAYHEKRMSELSEDAPQAYRAALERQPAILTSLTPAYLDSLEAGIAHEDFSPDNMLFETDGLAAILDFDRMGVNFILHDIGRVLLSLTLIDGRLDAMRVRAFTRGYTRHLPFGAKDLADALRVTWCIETPWWVNPPLFSDPKPKIARFRDELLWLTENYFELDEICEGLL